MRQTLCTPKCPDPQKCIQIVCAFDQFVVNQAPDLAETIAEG